MIMVSFGLHDSTATLATALTLAAAINCIGIGFQRGTHTRWQLVANDGTSAPTLTDMGASFSIATGGALTLFIAAPPNGSSVWVRLVDEVSGAVFEQEITPELSAATQFSALRLFLNTGATAAEWPKNAPKPGEDGTIAVQFGACDGVIPNCLPIMDGWNYMVRLYRARPEILDGSLSFPEPVPVQ